MEHKYLIRLVGSDIFTELKTRTQPPIGVAEFLEVSQDAECASDYDIVDVEEMGSISRQAVLNKEKRDARLAAEAKAQEDEADAKAQEVYARQTLKARLSQYDIQIDAMNSLSELKGVLKQMAKDIGSLANKIL